MPEIAEQVARLNEIEDVMARLRVGRSTVFGLLASKELRSVKIGRRRLVPERALLDYIARLDEQPDADERSDADESADGGGVGDAEWDS